MGKPGRPWKYSADVRQDAVNRYLGGDPVPDIARDFDVSTRTVARWVAAAGEPLRGNSPYSDEVREEAVRRYAAGDSSTTVANEVGASTVTVLKWVRDAGYETRRRGDYFDREPDVRASVVKAYARGVSAATLAAEYGVCAQTVYNWAAPRRRRR